MGPLSLKLVPIPINRYGCCTGIRHGDVGRRSVSEAGPNTKRPGREVTSDSTLILKVLIGRGFPFQTISAPLSPLYAVFHTTRKVSK
ncbi:hypothetical protein AVEN_84558-1 [Araneus ventricosus]|uniref:Uncharacterized protein n=1 Tax=Araneus ventricosus TaxID=182803 RepID=A0A4Y2C1S1_ARAVE|nr:hypothetical protein AVEN_84558-1 [Araneus ventricosus]